MPISVEQSGVPQRPCGFRARSWVLIAALSFIGCLPSAQAQDKILVPRGKEIVVSYKPTRPSSPVGAHALRHLRVPSDLQVRDLIAQGRMAVVSDRSGRDGDDSEPIQVDASEIRGRCARIIHANRGLPLHCEANVVRFLKRVPNDPHFSDLYGLTQMDAPNAWEVTTGSPNVIVAIVDTGVYYNHTDLIDNIVVNRNEIPHNGIDDDANGYIDDYFGYDFFARDGDPVDEHEQGHGTHCAGVLGASGDNGSGVVGINWKVGILAVRALGPDGGGSDANVAAGIQFAVHRGASIISLSLGGSSSSAVLENAIQYARDAGVLVVAASGNETENNDIFPSYPANSSLENVVAVAATDSTDRLASFSNYGANSVHVAAPGARILSTHFADQLVTMSGTSMATPYVAGVAALMKAANPALGYRDLKWALIASSDPLTALRGKVIANGRVNAYRAVLTAASGVIAPPPTPVAAPGENAEVRKITVSTRRYGRRTIVHGHIRTSAKQALGHKHVYLSCKTIKARRTKSDEDGYYAFKVSRPRRAERCFVKDGLAARSRSIVVQ